MTELHKAEYIQELIEKGLNFCVEAGKSIILAILIYILGKIAIMLLNRMMVKMLNRRHVDPTIQTFLKSLVNILMMVLLFVSIVGALGINTTSFAALLASAGVAVGMALSGNLQNLAGGIVILLFRPFKVGDYIEAQGAGGTVKEIQIFHTILNTSDNKKVYLPNGSLSSDSIVNYSKEERRRLEFVLGVEYGEDIDKVRQVLRGIVDADERVLQSPEPLIVLGELATSSVNIKMRIWVNSENYWNVFFDMNEKIYKEFNKKEINFPYPQLTIHQA